MFFGVLAQFFSRCNFRFVGLVTCHRAQRRNKLLPFELRPAFRLLFFRYAPLPHFFFESATFHALVLLVSFASFPCTLRLRATAQLPCMFVYRQARCMLFFFE